jgi:UDP-N-acetylglucosamine 2-epimerase (non-hydrolysing)
LRRLGGGLNKLKVVSIIGTRPEIIRLSRVFAALDNCCEHLIIHTGQNYDYELNEIFFKDLGVRKPDYFLNCAGENFSNTIGNIIISVDRVLSHLKPEAVLVLGDTNSCLSVISAKRRKIPTFHMEAGNRCFDMRVPEEINRRIIDHTVDVNLPYSQIAREYLLREGLPPDLIVKTGSPMLEVLNYYRPGIDASDILHRYGLQEHKYFAVSAHREENIDSESSFLKLVKVINTLAEEYDLPVIMSTHPRTKKRIDDSNAKFHSKVRLIKPLGFYDYVKLQLSSKVTLSDSGTITEESSILKFHALNLREAHERPEGMEEGAVMMVGLNVDRIRQGILVLESQSHDNPHALNDVSDYDVPNVSEKIVRIIHSYTDYINRVIWRKNDNTSP